MCHLTIIKGLCCGLCGWNSSGECVYLFFFFDLGFTDFQEYFTYIEPIVHQRWAKTGEPGEKPPDHP